jgi:hypothetical protein
VRPYRVLITVDVLHLQRPSRTQRDAILAFLHRLNANPYTEGDYIESDETGRPGQIKVIRQYALTYWSDHAVCEVKVTKIERAD